MVHHTRGIVFHHTKYSESSIICKMYTEAFGLQTYMIKGVRRKASKTKMALFESLNLLDLVVYHKAQKSIHNIREVRPAYAYQDIPMNMHKRSFVFFLAELLQKAIREESPNQPLFNWLYNALVWLDLSSENYVDFHLIFMMQLSRFLGFYPKKTALEHQYFDLQEGLFSNEQPHHPSYLEKDSTQQMNLLLQTSFDDSNSLNFTNTDRKKMLDVMLEYYKLHLPNFGNMKSVDVLRMLF